MILFKKVADILKWLEVQRKTDRTTGFVPTMGALHGGHISLIKTSKKENDICICSLFVNPAQFNDPKDFEKYPVTIERDIELLETAGCDVVFLPTVKEVYPDNMPATKVYNLGRLETILEGEFRPGHFQGVCRVVDRLLNIVDPDKLYIGQKDYQQCMVITRLAELTGFKPPLEIIIAPTLREMDGLAMSSRNLRLSEHDRKIATTIFKCLSMLKNEMNPGNLETLKEKGRSMLVENGFKVDYVEIADASTLETVLEWDGKLKVVALIAAFLHEVRLIDNLLLN